MMVHQGFLSFSFCSSRLLSKLWPAKLYSKINMVLNTCFVLRRSSILHLAFRSAILSTLSFEMVLCHSWQFPFVIHTLSRMRYFKPIVSSLELPWVIFHLKPSIGNVANCGAYHWSKLSPYPSRWKKFSSLLWSQTSNCFSLVAEFHLKYWDVFISPFEAYHFIVDFSTTPFKPSS